MTGAPYAYECTNRDRVLGNGCRTRAKRGKLEKILWETLVSVLRDPHHLTAHVQRRADRLGVREIEARSTAEHLRRQHADLSAQEDRMLALWGSADLPDDTRGKVMARLGEIARQRRAVAERLGRAEREAAAIDADQAQQEAVQRACDQARRGLARLARSPEKRQRLLRQLVNAVVVRGDRVEIDGVLPSLGGIENAHAITAP
jgi:hypothetical protein